MTGDGPLSIGARPSGLKRDPGRRATSTGQTCQVNGHAMSRLTPETTAGTPARNYRPGRACPDRPRAIPCTVQAVSGHTPRKKGDRRAWDMRGMILDDTASRYTE